MKHGRKGLPKGRTIARTWHKWFGIIIGGWLFLLALSGCVITWYGEIDAALNYDLRAERMENAELADIESVLVSAQNEFDELHMKLTNYPSNEHNVFWSIAKVEKEGRFFSAEIFSHPYTGEILGWRESGQLSLSRRNFINFFYGLHIDFLLGPWMTTVFGFMGLAWCIDHLISIYLSLPKLEKWRASFLVSGRWGSLRNWFDMHRAVGMWMIPVTFTVALTGTVLSIPTISHHVVEIFSEPTGRLHYKWEDPAAELTHSRTREIVEGAGIVAKDIHSIRYFPYTDAIAIRTFHERDLDDQGRMWNYYRISSGDYIDQRHDNGSTAGDTFFAWQYPLHSGKAFGLPGRILVFISGLVTMLLCGSGWYLWIKRRSR